MATGSEPLSEHPTTKASEPSEMVNIDIAAEGDVTLVLQQTRLRVSSVILSSASPVFNTMFGPNFAEGQGQRSAGHPREVTLHDDDTSAMIKLCRILHHQFGTVDTPLTSIGPVDSCPDGLFALSVLSDKYDCNESVDVVIKYVLSELASTSLSPLVSSMALLILSAVAYEIKDCRHFALFTRRLVLDVSFNYSSLAGQYALEALPNTFLLLLEEQRNAAWTEFRDKLPKLADEWCLCGSFGTGLQFSAAIAGKAQSLNPAATRWPHYSNIQGLRVSLEVAHNRGDVTIKYFPGCVHSNPD